MKMKAMQQPDIKVPTVKGTMAKVVTKIAAKMGLTKTGDHSANKGTK